jgi:hypothetical protein
MSDAYKSLWRNLPPGVGILGVLARDMPALFTGLSSGSIFWTGDGRR